MTMITKQDIIDYIYNNFQEALYNIHLFKKQIICSSKNSKSLFRI